MISCPHCSKEVPDVVAKATFDERISKLSEKNKELSTNLQKAEGLAKQAAPLAARANGYESDEVSLDILQGRFAKAQSSGYESDFASWLGDVEGAGKDSAAARFRASAPPSTPPAPPKPPESKPADPPAPPPVSRLPSTPTIQSAPVVVKMTAEQVSAANAKLQAQYKTATPEMRAKIKAEMDKNWESLGSAG